MHLSSILHFTRNGNTSIMLTVLTRCTDLQPVVVVRLAAGASSLVGGQLVTQLSPPTCIMSVDHTRTRLFLSLSDT